MCVPQIFGSLAQPFVLFIFISLSFSLYLFLSQRSSPFSTFTLIFFPPALFASCLSRRRMFTLLLPYPLLAFRFVLSSSYTLLFSVSRPISLFLSFSSLFAPYYFISFPPVFSVLPQVQPLPLALPKLSWSRFKIIQLTPDHFYPRASSPSSSPPQGRSSSLVLRRTRYIPPATL